MERALMAMKEKVNLEFDSRMLADLRRLSETTEIPLETVIERMIVAWYAHNDARRAIAPGEVCFEFSRTEGGELIDNAPLYRLIRSGIESKAREAWRERARLLDAAGGELDAEQTAYIEAEKRAAEMRRHEALNTRQDALECAQARLDFEWIPTAFPDDQLAQWMQLIRRGKATFAQLREACANWKPGAENE